MDQARGGKRPKIQILCNHLKYIFHRLSMNVPGKVKAKPTTWIFTSKALGSGQGMTLKEILWFSVEASQCMNAYPDNHNTFGLGCHLEIIIKHRLAHGISCTSHPTWEQPVPHCSAASVPRHINYRQERQSKCLHAVSCLFLPALLNHSFVPSFQYSSSPRWHFARTIPPAGVGQCSTLEYAQPSRTRTVCKALGWGLKPIWIERFAFSGFFACFFFFF